MKSEAQTMRYWCSVSETKYSLAGKEKEHKKGLNERTRIHIHWY